MLNGEWKCSMTSFRLPYIYTAIGIDAIKYIYIYISINQSLSLSFAHAYDLFGGPQCVCAMILAYAAYYVYAALAHAVYGGATPARLIFPLSFL